MKVLLLGGPGAPGEQIERWHDDVHQGALELGWSVDFLSARGLPVGDVVRSAKGADMLLWLRTHSHNLAGDGHAMLRRIEEAGTVTVGLHLDLYWGLPGRERRIGAEPWWTCQHVWTADGGDRDWASKGVRTHRWCPPPFGSRYLGYGIPDQALACDAVFVGGYVPSIHGPHRSRLLSWARARWGARFRHVGSSRHNRLYRRHLNHLYASAGLAVGDSAPADFYWSDRVPRTLGRGGLFAYPRTAGLESQGFTDEVMVLYDRGRFDQITDRLAGLDARARRRMTDAAIALISERHLWRHRLEEIARVALG